MNKQLDELSYLYHYTSIETLALILRNKTIRFSSLSRVDDIEEQKTKDYGDLGRFCFVSCWTNETEESIPLWNLYTPNMSGVRIRLPINPFKTIKISPDGRHINGEYITHPSLTNEKLSTHGCLLNPPYFASLYQVQYINDPDKLNRTVLTEMKPETKIENGAKKTSWEKNISLKSIGIYKNKNWTFQKEYRYKFFVVPWTLSDLESAESYEDQAKLINRLETEKLKKDYFDLELDEHAMHDMEILIGPRANYAQKQIIESLVNDLNPSAIILESNLGIR
ncbi:DUF2971 domain-containing protein [Alkalihalobacterium sp. APHAB7]|uniref:DUF2971 domain-containing protein n=1 Tax=Alkalihalobacterium sp. APHAB7 TaxID=3402081 RepID=UPI003AB0A8F1